MSRYFPPLALAFAMLGVAAPSQAQGTEHALKAARDTVWRAFFRNDTALLRRYIPPSAATLEGESAAAGRWSTRADIMKNSREFVRSKARLVDVTFDNTQIAIAGHSAILRSNYAVIVSEGARTDTMRGRATELFVRLGDTWTNPYWQLEQGAVGAAREIALPDTMGANFALGDSARGLATASDYDALVGTWEFRFQPRREDGAYWPSFTGHWTFEKVAGGGIVEDRWRPDDPETPMAQSLHTYRTFDPKQKVWQMYGSEAEGGQVQPGLTWSDASGRYAIQWNRGVLSRIRYLEITADRFLWRSDISRDGGTTWLLDAGMMEARLVGK